MRPMHHIEIGWEEGPPTLHMEDAVAALHEGEEMPYGAQAEMTWNPQEDKWEFIRDAEGKIVIKWRKR